MAVTVERVKLNGLPTWCWFDKDPTIDIAVLGVEGWQVFKGVRWERTQLLVKGDTKEEVVDWVQAQRYGYTLEESMWLPSTRWCKAVHGATLLLSMHTHKGLDAAPIDLQYGPLPTVRVMLLTDQRPELDLSTVINLKSHLPPADDSRV